MSKPEYCTQNEGDCNSCSLVSYGQDCWGHKLWSLGDLKHALSIPERSIRKLLNDAGATPRLDELQDNPAELVSQTALIDLLADRPGIREARIIAGLLAIGGY